MNRNNEPNGVHNIVVCCDGTWCGTETGTRSNIQIIADAFTSKDKDSYVQALDGIPQHNDNTNTDVCYFNGVGLSGREDLEGRLKRPLGLLGGFADTLLYITNCVTADDLQERCKEAYDFIADKYQGPEVSRIWLFGLSRGAYTVRAVAGMINNCGIVRRTWMKDEKAVHKAPELLQEVYDFYRSKENKPDDEASEDFRKKHSWKRGNLPPVIFMGLLDTVGAAGFPRIEGIELTYDYDFHDVAVSSEVQHVFQAVSIHDRLAVFEPCPVRRGKDSVASSAAGDAAGTGKPYAGVNFSMQEVWFPGAHYDVGRQDFVLSNKLIIHKAFKVFNPLRTNVDCLPELADYPLLGRALPAHRSPGGGSSSSSSSSSTSEWCLVAQVHKHSPELLPPAEDDRFWAAMVEGNITDPKADSIGANEQPNEGLFERGKKLLDSVTSILTLPLAVPVAATTAACEWLLPKHYTIDAETKILGPVLEPLAAVLGPVVSSVNPDLLLKDRSIPLPTRLDESDCSKDQYAPFPGPCFFEVPGEGNTFKSYLQYGRELVDGTLWFRSRTYNDYLDKLATAEEKWRQRNAQAGTQAAAAAGLPSGLSGLQGDPVLAALAAVDSSQAAGVMPQAAALEPDYDAVSGSNIHQDTASKGPLTAVKRLV